MKTLYLVRHAKSEWENESISDVERPLTARGYRDANAMGKRLKEKKHIPDAIISSPAIRAISTALIFVRNMGKNPAEIRFAPNLYEASVNDYKKVIAETDNKYGSIMLFAHNPTISNCASSFVPMTESLPTCAVVCISCDCASWEDFEKGNKKLVFQDAPKSS
jgi:phosphohistidine phosphatase